MTSNPITQAENILTAEALHLARVVTLNISLVARKLTPVEPDDVIFHEIPGKPGLLRYEYVTNTPSPIHAHHITGPKPIPKLNRKQKWWLLTTAITADILQHLRRQP